MYPITLTKKLEDIEICGMKLGDLDHPDFKYPWELIVWLRQNIIKNLKLKIENCPPASQAKALRAGNLKLKIYKACQDVFVGQDVRIADYVAFDQSNGQILIDDKVNVSAFSYVEGPCYIGQNCQIMPHSQIRKNTSIGHDCKIGGEVSGSIFQPYANKAHYGFIGDSYIGSWVNLGAGTTNSNLKNTYGNVRIEIKNQRSKIKMKNQNFKIDTGQQFLGCIIGDYVKTAINTSIYTGKIIGVCAQLFGVIDENVGSFVMKMPDGVQKEFELDAAIRSQKRMFERRGIVQTADDVKMLERVFEETRGERNF